jgi:hypothetical protein
MIASLTLGPSLKFYTRGGAGTGERRKGKAVNISETGRSAVPGKGTALGKKQGITTLED